MRVYISGKISGLEKAEYTARFRQGENDARAYFAQFGADEIKLHYISGRDPQQIYYVGYEDEKAAQIQIINPLDIKEGLTYNDCMRNDITAMMRCNGIWMLNNWKDSKGARFEHYIAKWLNFAIGYEND